MKTPVGNTTKEHWQEMIQHRDDVLLEDVDIYKDYIVLSERSNGLTEIRIKRWDGKEYYLLTFNNETYMAYTTQNLDFDSKVLLYVYNALIIPAFVIDFDM